MSGPPIWDHFVRYLRLPDALAAAWWKALWQSRWSEATALRKSFLLHASVPTLDTRGLVHETASSPALVHMLTNLEKEALISFSIINTLMEFVLGCTYKD